MQTRREEVIKLRKKNYSFEKIGKFLNISKQRACAIYQDYAPVDKNMKEDALFRDNNSCVLCGEKKNLHIYHIDKDRRNNKLNNLITLCGKCHGKKHREINKYVLKKKQVIEDAYKLKTKKLAFYIPEVAKILKKTESTVRKYCRDERIKATKYSHGWVISKKSLERYIANTSQN